MRTAQTNLHRIGGAALDEADGLHFIAMQYVDGLDVLALLREEERLELRRRQALYGLTLEDMELILAPMVETAKEAIGSMGDDTPLAVISATASSPSAASSAWMACSSAARALS